MNNVNNDLVICLEFYGTVNLSYLKICLLENFKNKKKLIPVHPNV